jgi:hypothetical protein
MMQSLPLEYCIVRVWAAVTTGPQPIRVWGGATLAATSLTLMGCHNPLGLGLGEAQPLVLLSSLAAAPLGCRP